MPNRDLTSNIHFPPLGISMNEHTSQDEPMTPESTDRQQTIDAVAEIVDEVRVAMLTTVAEDGSLHSRPMLTASPTFGPEMYFITEAGDQKCSEIRDDEHVNLIYACPSRDKYASISGTSLEIIDSVKLEALWVPDFEKWFPGGLDDSDLRLLMIRVQRAEYWDEQSSRISRAIELVKSVVTGSSTEHAEHGEITWPNTF